MKTIRYLIPVFFALLVSSCCRSREEGRSRFTEEQNRLIPYQKGTIVSFIDHNGEVVSFKTSERKTWWGGSMDLFSEGCSDYIRFETGKAVLSSTYDDSKIELWMNLNADRGADGFFYDGELRWDGSCSIHIGMNLIYSDCTTYLDFNLQADKDGAFFTDDPSVSFFEYHEINNYGYYDVIEKNQTATNPYGGQIPVRLFYNKDYGILQIDVAEKNFLMLNR